MAKAKKTESIATGYEYGTTKIRGKDGKVRKQVKKMIKEEKYAELKLLCEGIQTEVIRASKVIPEGAKEPVQYAKPIVDNIAAFAMDLPSDLSMAFLLVVSGPEAPALMDELDKNEVLFKFVKKAMDTGAFKVPA